MAVTEMLRVRTVLTGVAGSPYYMTGYFDAQTGTPTQAITAWHTFISGGGGATSGGIPSGARVETLGEVQLVNPVNGDVTGAVVGTPAVTTGTGVGPFLPPANQLVVRWRTGIYESGREIRGKTFIPSRLESESTATGQVETAATTAFNSLASALIANALVDLVVWSRKYGQWALVSSGSTWNQFGVLRSRRD